SNWRKSLRALIVVGGGLLIFADEIIGRYQFHEICRQHRDFEFGPIDPKGRTAKIEINPKNERVLGVAIPIFRTRTAYRDINTGDLLVAVERFQAKGGLLVRWLKFSEGEHPFLI